MAYRAVKCYFESYFSLCPRKYFRPTHTQTIKSTAVTVTAIMAPSDGLPLAIDGVGGTIETETEGGGPYFTIGVTGTPYIGWTTWDRAPAENELTIAMAATMGDRILASPEAICFLISSMNCINNY
jgi:hypothetical protein